MGEISEKIRIQSFVMQFNEILKAFLNPVLLLDRMDCFIEEGSILNTVYEISTIPYSLLCYKFFEQFKCGTMLSHKVNWFLSYACKLAK